MRYPAAFERLVACFHKFQGIGRKTSERLVFDLLSKWDDAAIEEFSNALLKIRKNICFCPECRSLIEKLPCPFCTIARKGTKILCIVAGSKDVYAIENTRLYQGSFFVLGSLLSPLDERGVETMDIPLLKAKIADGVEEVILALDSSLEGDATASFLRNELEPLSVKVTRLATGVPVGASLDFVDRGTLSRALSGRYQM
jgi:recombination protein RecR